MQTLVQFALRREGDYLAALALLAEAGFRRLRSPRRGNPRTYPAAVVADLCGEPSAVTRAVFEQLTLAGLAPIAVMASTIEATPPSAEASTWAISPRPLACA